MKKVKLIGKKVMSVGLAAILLVAPVSSNRCSAAIDANDCKMVAKISAGVAVAALTVYWGLEDTDAAKALATSMGIAIEGAGKMVYYTADSIYKIISAVGAKNALAGVGLWNMGKLTYEAYNKAKAWFKSEPKKEKSGVQNFNVNLKIN